MERFDINLDKFDAGVRITLNGLFQGGYLLSLFDKAHKTLDGIILDNNGKYNGTWDFPPHLKISDYFGKPAFRNGTQLLVAREDEMSWKILSFTLPKFFSDGKHNMSCYM